MSRCLRKRPGAVRLLAPLILLGLLAGGALGAERIRILSFNIAEFGEGSRPRYRDLPGLVRILTLADADLIAIQEVGTGEAAAAQLDRLVGALNDTLADPQHPYFSLITPTSGDERCAVVFRDPVVQEGELVWLDQDLDPDNPRLGGTLFTRIPVGVPFRAGAFDFTVVICHLAYTDKARREVEVSILRDFLLAPDEWEDDWIVLGDFNRCGGYGTTQTPAFELLLADGWRDHYRFPLLEAITDPDDMTLRHAPEDSQSTTEGDERWLYDQFIITAGVFPEFDAEDPVFGREVGVIAFDRWPEYAGLTGSNVVKYLISDHRPIWLDLRCDGDDDD